MVIRTNKQTNKQTNKTKQFTWALSSAKLLPRTGCINRRTEHRSHFSMDKARRIILCTTLSNEVCSSKMSWTSSSKAYSKKRNWVTFFFLCSLKVNFITQMKQTKKNVNDEILPSFTINDMQSFFLTIRL